MWESDQCAPVNQKKKRKKKAVGGSEERRTAPLLPSRARSYNQGGGTPPFLIPAEQQLQARPRPGARRRQRPRGAAPAAPGPSLSLHGRPGRRGEQFGWQLDGVAGVRATSSALRRARRGWRLQCPKPPRAGWAPPASLIGNPPFGTAPSGCLCTGRSRPRCG